MNMTVHGETMSRFPMREDTINRSIETTAHLTTVLKAVDLREGKTLTELERDPIITIIISDGHTRETTSITIGNITFSTRMIEC